MMQDYYLAQVRNISANRKKTLAGIKNSLQAKKYVDSVRKKIVAVFGPLPERTPLNARTVGIIRKKGVTIEKVIFYSRPDFPVTGNLYLPDVDNALACKKLKFLSPWNALFKPLTKSKINSF